MDLRDLARSFVRLRLKSFRYAFQGAQILLRTQRNAWIHSVVTILVVLVGLWFPLSAREWALLAVAIGLVWMAEAFNTAIEFLADEVTRERRPGIGHAKDVAAFGVLCAAAIAVVIGAMVFGPHLCST